MHTRQPATDGDPRTEPPAPDPGFRPWSSSLASARDELEEIAARCIAHHRPPGSGGPGAGRAGPHVARDHERPRGRVPRRHPHRAAGSGRLVVGALAAQPAALVHRRRGALAPQDAHDRPARLFRDPGRATRSWPGVWWRVPPVQRTGWPSRCSMRSPIWPIPRGPKGVLRAGTIDPVPPDAGRWPRRMPLRRSPYMRTLAGWCVRHRRIVVLSVVARPVVSIFYRAAPSAPTTRTTSTSPTRSRSTPSTC